MKSSTAQRQLLYCPGPVNTHISVKRAASDNEIGHREPEFSELLISIQEKLLNLYGVSSEEGYHAAIITGSGTAANEAIFSSAVQDKHVLVVTNGEFGNRLFDISSLHNTNTHKLEFQWAQPIDLVLLEKYLIKNEVDVIAMVHHETSTGMLNPIMEVGALANRYGKQFFLDTVSSAGAELINLKEAYVTFCSGSASKAICSLPGVAYVVGPESAFEALAELPAKTMYLNLYKFYTFSKTYQQTPNTPAVQSFFALDQALSNILDSGMKKKYDELRKKARYFRAEMARLGFTFLISEPEMSCVLTTVVLPVGLTMASLNDYLKARGIIIYGGKGPLLDKVFQVSHIGSLTTADLGYFISCVEAVLLETIDLPVLIPAVL
jgi:2-aminoethylphosphonate-pyruvate transaminase